MNFFQKLKSAFTSGGSWVEILQGSSHRNKISATEAQERYRNIVYSCIEIISDDIQRYTPIIKDGDRVLKDHALLRLLANPNPQQQMSQADLFKWYAIYMYLHGEVFWMLSYGEMTNKPRTIDYLHPDKMKVVIDDSMNVVGYVYRTEKGTDVPLDLNEVWHMKRPNPRNPYRGLSVIEAGLTYIDTEDSASDFQLSYLTNQATPSGVLMFNGTIKKETFDKIKKQWKENQSGTKNAGKTLFIRGGKDGAVSFEKMGLSLADLDLDQLTNISEQKVLNVFRVPKALLGQTDSTGLGRNNIEAIEYIFSKRVIDPQLTVLDNNLERLLLNVYKERYVIEHSNVIPKDKEFELKEIDSSCGKWRTVNEIRKLKGLDPVDGGDKLYVDFSKMPIDEQPVEEAVRNLSVNHDCGHDHSKKKELKTTNPFYIALDKLEVQSGKLFLKKFVDLLKEQKELVIDQLGGIVGKQIVETNALLGFELIFTREDLQAVFLTSLITAFRKAGVMTVDQLDDPEQEFVVEQSTRNAVFESTERLMQSFNQTTSIKLQQQLTQGLANGESLEEITARVESIYEEATGYRAERIARTETHKAVNWGSAEAYKQSGVKQVQWVAYPDACEFCAAMHGSITNIGTPFIPLGGSITGTDGGEMINDYYDISYADAHPNCDCKLEPVK